MRAGMTDSKNNQEESGLTLTATSGKSREGPLGHACIRGYLRRLDSSPGVYRMLDRSGAVLYVGKARNLKARVSNYARPAGHSPRIARMISETASMMFLTTRTETEALLLEQNLIKQLKPRYNVLLRDDKSFPNILVSKSHDFPQIKKHRGRKSEVGSYYGPFASAGAVNRTLNQLQKVFLLRNCSDATFESRTRPCLLYQIKRCSGPCVGHVGKAEYAALVADAEAFLQGKSTRIQSTLASQMDQASEAMEFERAAALRDRIRALTQVQATQGINPRGVTEADVIALHMEGGQACVQVFFIRANQSWGNRDYYPRTGSGAGAAEVLQAFIGQFYDDRDPPRQLLLSDDIEDRDLVTEALSEKAGRKVEVLVPQRGEKHELVVNALRNARESLARRMAESATQTRLLDGLAEAFGLDAPPRRIEVYDNSHIQGTDAVGAMIVAGPEGFLKSQYRKFNIRGEDLTPGDDFGMMKEVLTRRFKRLLKEDPDRAERSLAGPPADRRRGRAGECGAWHHGRTGGRGHRDGRRRQGHRPRRRERGIPPLRRASLRASAQRPRPLLRPADARRGASLRHRRASGEALEGRVRDSARRGAGRGGGAQARASGAFRQRQGREPRKPQGSHCRGGHFRRVGCDDP